MISTLSGPKATGYNSSPQLDPTGIHFFTNEHQKYPAKHIGIPP